MEETTDIDVSISVVVYRDYEAPLVLLRSLTRHVSPTLNVTLTFVDNGEPQSNGELVAARKKLTDELVEYPWANYIDAKTNLGYGAANNLVLAQSASRYHAFVNPDIVFVEDALSKLVGFMDANPCVGMCVPRMIDEQGVPQQVYRTDPALLDILNRTILHGVMKRREARHELADRDRTSSFAVPFAQGSFLLGRTKLLRDLGGFDNSYFMYLEDADLCRRVNQRSVLTYVPDATVIHRWKRESHKNPNLLRAHLRSFVKYFRKWGVRVA